MISVKDLGKLYYQANKDIVALRDVNLEVGPGLIHGVIGPSGAGKSTLVRCLTLLERPSTGSVSIDGEDLSTLSEKHLRGARRRLGMVFQHANLLDSRTTAENVSYPLELTGLEPKKREARVAELLSLVGLSDFAQSYPSQLSGGQKQRVGIARALAADPHVLLCDEPTSALDPKTTSEILALLKGLREKLQLTIIIITHEMSVVKNLCDSVSLLAGGTIVESGTISEVASHLGSDLSEALLPLPEPKGFHPESTIVEILYSGEEAKDPLLASLIRDSGVDLSIISGTVEDLGGHTFGHFHIQVPEDITAEQRRDFETLLTSRNIAFKNYERVEPVVAP